MRSIDFSELKRLITVRELLVAHQWKPTERHGEQMRGPCPVHKSARPGSRSFAVRGPTWYCHSCKRGGVGSLDLFMWMTGESSVHQAAVSLCFLFAIAVPVKRPDASFLRNRKRNK